jgi:hypothetical protein
LVNQKRNHREVSGDSFGILFGECLELNAHLKWQLIGSYGIGNHR